MNRTGGSQQGAGCELVLCSGKIQQCTFKDNSTKQGGGLWLSLPPAASFELTGNTFLTNMVDSYSSFGGGAYVEGDYSGEISENLFYKNISKSYCGTFLCDANSHGGGFYVAGSFTGVISGNTFVDNDANSNVDGYGGGFKVEGVFSGEITQNIFAENAAKNNGAGFYLNAGGEDPDQIILSNNIFLYNTTVNAGLNGDSFFSKASLNVLNNTFYGGNGDQSCANIPNSASASIFKNNMFADVHTAIWEEGELELTISYNDFYDLSDILNRNTQAMGNDAAFIDLLLAGSSNNHYWAPGLAGEDADTGTWSGDPVYDGADNVTVFTDATKNWTSEQWAGAMVNLSTDPGTRKHFWIVGNTTTQIMVKGNLAGTGIGAQGEAYSIDDYHLAQGSQNIDAGTFVNITQDFEDGLRPQGGGFEIGADEFDSVGSTPSIIANTSGNGSITPSGEVNIEGGTDQTFSITPAENHRILDVIVDGVSVGPVSQYDFLNVTEPGHTICAIFVVSAINLDPTIFIDQTSGANTSGTAGTEGDPFKSITYALLTMDGRGAADPWVVHVKAGVYDADPAKPAGEREIFPIELREGMTLQGDDGAGSCIISGSFNADSQVALVYGENLSGITIVGLALTAMNRTGGSQQGAGCELVLCSGKIQQCTFKDNSTKQGGGLWLSLPPAASFELTGNTFLTNMVDSYSSFGGGAYVEGDCSGEISENLFYKNISKSYCGTSLCDANSHGGGFYVAGSFTGVISGNTFVDNDANSNVDGYGGGFKVEGVFSGEITQNIFAENAAKNNGAGFYLNAGGEDPDQIILSNNIFLYNTTVNAGLNGDSFYSKASLNVLNNTFYGGEWGSILRQYS